ncbi:MAG TPA: glycosyl transferase [Cytophagales bacterium]|jgi:glycosyltransferase involved in cell wall biosynthesis|nr:glycosyl transferase [Cytophagales bacterium]
MNPLVSVICLCYNHEQFVTEALESVLRQTYPNIQFIIVDDFSLDESRKYIEQFIKKNSHAIYLPLPKNVGNCAAFNQALRLAQGEFVIDFSTDDVMLPDRVEKQVNFFSTLDQSYGVVFTDAEYIDSKGNKLRTHFDHLFRRKLIQKIPEGWIFRDVLRTYFICSPTMMFRKEVIDALKGYDENLVYEDFDFWVRSSRNFKYACLNEVTTRVRRTGNSMSSGWYEQGDQQLHSTYLICKKAVSLCIDEGDKKALLFRIRYEFKQAIFSGNKTEAKLFAELEMEVSKHNFQFYLFSIISTLPFPWSWIRKKYHQLFYG